MSDPTPTPKKVCTICGTDCADKPRVKDRRGNYYCKQCHDAALQKKRQRAEREAQQAMEAPPQLQSTPPADPGGAPDLEALLGEDLASATTATSSVCPACGTTLGEGAVLCVNCGYNTQAGSRLETKKLKAAKQKGASGGTSQLLHQPWPYALGVLGVELLVFAVGMTGSEPGLYAFIVLYAVVGMVTGVFLLIAAFMESVVQGFLSLCIPFWIIIFALFVSDSAWVKYALGVNILSAVLYGVLLASNPDLLQVA